MAVTFDEDQLKSLGLENKTSFLKKLSEHLVAKGVSGEVVPCLFLALAGSRLDAMEKFSHGLGGIDFPDGVSACLFRDTLSIMYPLSSGEHDQQNCLFMGVDEQGLWYAFPNIHDQHGITCISLVKLCRQINAA